MVETARDKPIYIVGGTWRALAKLHMEYSGYGLEVLHQYDVRPKEIAAFFKFMAKDGRRAQRIISHASGNRREALPAASLILQTLIEVVKPSTAYRFGQCGARRRFVSGIEKQISGAGPAVNGVRGNGGAHVQG